MIVELPGAMHGIDRRDYAVQPVARADQWIGHQGMDDRGGVGEPGRFDQCALELRHLAAHPAQEQVAQGRDQVAAYAAAQTSGIEQDDVFIDLAHQQMIDSDIAELVDENRGLAHARVGEQGVDQGRLAASEKARDDGNGYGGGIGRAPFGHFP